jgi:hypothetical protein
MHAALQSATFHVEHVIPLSRGGKTDADNLAMACPSCNLHKADRVDAVDPPTGMIVLLYHPRRDRWIEHFQISGYEVQGQNPVGRATVNALQLNRPRRLLIRRAEEVFGLFPPRNP